MRARRVGIAAIVIAVALSCLAARQSFAQVTTANVRGQVVSGDDATPIADATVVIINISTGVTSSTTSNDTGEFAFTGLDVGGPYRVSAEVVGFKQAVEERIFLSAGKTRQVTLALKLQEEVVEVSGTTVSRSTSDRTVITAQQIDELPSISRDPRDLVRLTPDADVEGTSNTMSIGGMNNRYNSVTVDGIREDDDFGLNTSGYPTRRSPIALSAIQEMTVESAPYDVRYSDFMGGNVNIVTKSGTNDWHGELLATYSSSAMMGNHIGENELTNNHFREIRYGAEVGGPIAKDKAHFMISVEGLNASTPVDAGPEGSGAVNVTSKVTEQELQMAQQIAHDVYGFTAGTPNRSLGETDFKVFSKFDWQINNEHRFIASYQRTGGTADTGSTSTSSNLYLSSNWYNEADTLNAFSARLYSNWTDKFSTQLVFDGKLVSSIPTPLDGDHFMAAQIRTPEGGTIVLGPDDFHQTNSLTNDLIHGRAEFSYLLGKSLLTGGLEYQYLHIDNLFIADTNGGAVYPSLAAFSAMAPSQITYNNAVTLNPTDGAAKWSSGTLSAYLQDQITLDRLTVQAGLREETYISSNKIMPNPFFEERYGFSNTATLNGRSILMPRIGGSYLATDDLNLRAGGGLYSGGTPTVWVSNSYSNNGVSVANAFSTNPAVIDGFDGRTIPQSLQAMIKEGNGDVNALDPNFKIPSQWKVGGGLDWAFMHGAMLKLNYTFSKVNEGVTWEDLRRNLDLLPDNVPVGTTPDGRPEYDITNFNVHRGYDMLLTNTTQGYGHVASAAVEKSFPFGLMISGTYAFEHVLEVNPANSSQAISNYDYVAVSDPQHPGLAISNYEREHRFTATIQYSHAIIGDLTDAEPWKNMKTTVAIFAEARSGQPYSWTFGDANFGTTLGRIFGEDSTFASKDRELFYVPKGDGSDVILSGIDPNEFNTFLKQTGLDKYRGQIAPRNAFQSPWFDHFDMRFAQDLPNPFGGQRARAFLDITNASNLLGDLLGRSWGRSAFVPFPYATPAVDVAIDPSTGKYIYSNLRPANATVTDLLSSVWRIGVGVMYDF